MSAEREALAHRAYALHTRIETGGEYRAYPGGEVSQVLAACAALLRAEGERVEGQVLDVELAAYRDGRADRVTVWRQVPPPNVTAVALTELHAPEGAEEG